MREDCLKESPYGLIPQDWVFQPLAAVLGVVMDYRGRTPTKLGMEWGGGEIPALSAKNVCMGKVDLSRETYFGSDALYERWMTSGDPERGDVLMTLEAPLGNIAWIPDERKYILSQRVVLLRPRPSMVDKEYLGYQLMSEHFQSALVRNSTGTTATGIQRAKLETIPVLIPRSLDEQRRIGAAINTINEAIAKTEAVIAKLKHVRAGLLHDLLTRGIDEHAQLRDPIAHPEQFQDSPLGRIPYEWRVAQLREVADIASGVTLGRNLDGAGTLELPYLRVANVQDGYLNLADVKTVRIFPDELDRFRLRRGDVLMNEGGDYDKLGRGTVWEDQIPVCLHQNHVFRVRCRRDVLNCYFLSAISGSEIGKRYFLRSSKQSTNLASINSTQLNAFEIPVPGLAEQEAIIKILKAQDDQLTTEARGLAKLYALKSGLMSDLLSGRVRVPESVSTVENQP